MARSRPITADSDRKFRDGADDESCILGPTRLSVGSIMTESFQTFTALHVPGNPLILFNVWDAGSAIAAERAGAKAIAAGRASVAAAKGVKVVVIFSINEATPT